jgi:hypothetical protein
MSAELASGQVISQPNTPNDALAAGPLHPSTTAEPQRPQQLIPSRYNYAEIDECLRFFSQELRSTYSYHEIVIYQLQNELQDLKRQKEDSESNWEREVADLGRQLESAHQLLNTIIPQHEGDASMALTV